MIEYLISNNLRYMEWIIGLSVRCYGVLLSNGSPPDDPAESLNGFYISRGVLTGLSGY